VPQVTFADRATLELGGTVVELTWVGRNHSDNSLVMRFPRERVLFAVDFIPVRTVAWRDFPDAYIADWIDSLKEGGAPLRGPLSSAPPGPRRS
jgi:glyoxylase-like metal-dependent hydrolase (beta-lactamase superfamily II)